MRSAALWLVAMALPVLFAGSVRGDECLNKDGTPCPPCDPTDPNLLLPDLVAQTPTHVRNLVATGHRTIIFTTSIGNVGDGPLILHGHTVETDAGTKTQATQEIWKRDGTSCSRLAGYFVYHPAHHHFHIEDFSGYDLRKNDPFTGEIVASSNKVSFCLLDIAQLHGYNGPLQVQADCLNQEGTQGISVGFADVYDSFLPGQSIDLDADPAHPVPAGQYYLVNTANPDGVILQKNWSLENNSSVVSVSVPPPNRADLPLPTNTLPPGGSPPPTATPTSPLPTATPTSPPPPPPTRTPTSRPVRQPHGPHAPAGPPPQAHTPHVGGPHSPHSPH